MMTFKEYLIESTIMSTDALKQAMSDYEQRGIGKPAITKPSTKRLKQMDKRKARRAGEEEEELKRPSAMEKAGYNDGRSGVKMRYNQSPAYNRGHERGSNSQPKEEETEAKLHADKDRVFTTRKDPQHDVSIKRGGQRAVRRLRGRYGKGNPSPNAAGNLDDIYRK